MKTKFIFFCITILFSLVAFSQNVGSSPEYIKAITSLWQGERFSDGRPKVSDELLERLKKVPIEAAWSVLRNRGYESQFEGSWTVLCPENAMTGRVVSSIYAAQTRP